MTSELPGLDGAVHVEERVDHVCDLGFGLDEASDGEVGDREDVRANVDADVSPVRVLAQDEVAPKARLRGRVACGRREVLRLRAQPALVRVAEERDDGVVANDRHVADVIAGPVEVDDALDLLREQVRRVGAVGMVLDLLPQRRDPIRPLGVIDVDDHAVHPLVRGEAYRGRTAATLCRSRNPA